MTYKFNWLPAAGTLLLISGLLTMLVLRVGPGRALRAYGETLDQLKWAILTVASVLGAGLRDEPVRPDDHARAWIAGAGGVLRVPLARSSAGSASR